MAVAHNTDVRKYFHSNIVIQLWNEQWLSFDNFQFLNSFKALIGNPYLIKYLHVPLINKIAY